MNPNKKGQLFRNPNSPEVLKVWGFEAGMNTLKTYPKSEWDIRLKVHLSINILLDAGIPMEEIYCHSEEFKDSHCYPASECQLV
jgi:hypothetical protein